MKPTSDLMSYVTNMRNCMQENDLQLVYEGEVNQNVTRTFAELAEKNMDNKQEDTVIKKRVYHIIVECLQNICKHSDHISTGKPQYPGHGILLVGKNDNGYEVTTGNVIASDRKERIQLLIERVNEMDENGIKELHKQQLRETKLSDKGGAGLGLIDMVRKTGNRLEYSFEQLNELTTFFVLKMSIATNKNN